MANNWILSQEIDLQRGVQAPQVWPDALILCGDSNAHTWRVTILDDGKPAALSGTVTGYFIRGDDATVTVAGQLNGNVATVTLAQSCYNVEGNMSAVMRLKTSNGLLTLGALILPVRRMLTDTLVDQENIIPSLDDLLAQIELMEQGTAAANTAASKANTAASNADAKAAAANTAASAANTAAANANTKAAAADTATSKANTAASNAEKWANAEAAASQLAAGSKPTVMVTEKDGKKQIAFGIPKGDPGEEGGYYSPVMNGTVLEGWKPSNESMAVLFTNVDLRGPKGDTGLAGSSATVTSANIQSALGYKPASEESISQLSAKVEAIGTQEKIVQAVIAALPDASEVSY